MHHTSAQGRFSLADLSRALLEGEAGEVMRESCNVELLIDATCGILLPRLQIDLRRCDKAYAFVNSFADVIGFRIPSRKSPLSATAWPV